MTETNKKSMVQVVVKLVAFDNKLLPKAAH